MKGAEALVRSVAAQGIDTIFALPGVQLDEAFNALYAAQDDLRVVHTRHEQGTSYMAFGYAQSSGRPSACLVVPGPGVYNAAAGIATAYACNAPVLWLAGQIPSPFIGKGFGMLHEIDDQLGAVKAITKYRATVTRPEDAPAIIAEAMRHLTSGRRRPVAVEMAPDVLRREADITLRDREPAPAPPEPDGEAIERAVTMLAGAENAAIFVGGGIYGAEAELKRLAETLQIPVVMTQHGLGSMDWRHPLAQTVQGGAVLWPKLDVVLAVGTRFAMQMLDWGHDDAIKLIRVDVDPDQSIAAWQPDIHIVTEAKTALAALADEAARVAPSRPSREAEFEQLKQDRIKAVAEALPMQHQWSMAIRDVLPEDGVTVFDITQLHYYSWWGFPVYRPRTMIQPGYAGTLGYGLPTALGAQVANPGRKVVNIAGDGGFMFNVQEMATAVQHGINVVTVLFNDGAYGNVRRNQKLLYNGRYIATELKNPDFVKLADSFGMASARADTPDRLRAALDKALAADEPALIEVPVGEFPSWRDMHPVRKLR